MTILTRLDKNTKIADKDLIKSFLIEFGIEYTTWLPSVELKESDTEEEILKAYEHEMKPIMERKGFLSADVISVSPETPNVEEIRNKFLAEHTHSEDEVRFFIDGSGLFYFNLPNEVVSIFCEKGDFLSVPSGFKHWFDLAPAYKVKAIRLFTNKDGWIANYTGSKIESKY